MFHKTALAVILLGLQVWAAPKNEASFMRAIRNDFDSMQLRLDFADWLEADGQTHRAEFIRLAVKSVQKPHNHAISDQMFRLIDKHQEEIAPGLPSHYYKKKWTHGPIDFFRGTGFPIIESTVSSELLQDLEALLGDDSSSVVGLKLVFEHGLDPEFKALWKRKELKRVARLQIYSPDVESPQAFLKSPHLKNLHHLVFTRYAGLVDNHKAYALALGIAESETFSKLTHLWFPIRTDLGESVNSKRFQKLFKTYLKSKILRNVVDSPIIYPGSQPVSIDTRRPDRPYIKQTEWASRKGASCSTALTK